MASYTREEREARKNYAKERSIVEVAESLGMELIKSGASEYRWKEHDSMVITPRTNLWHWFSKDKGGDTIELVRTINNISFNQAIDYLNDGDYSEGTLQRREAPQAFKNYLEPYEQPFVEGRTYLKEVRDLSDETIDFFLDQNVITQANAKIGDVIEPVIVFKTIDHKGEMIGGNLQGIVENRERYDRHGYFKGIMRNSNGDNGLSVDIGRPERLIFAESPIDLMSYYELHKEQLENVRLVSMDGLKDGIIGTNLARLESEMRNVYMRDEDWDRDLLKKSVDDGYFNDGKHADVITLAVDNDQGGRNFIQSLEAKGVVVKAELPAEKDGFEKQDWNDVLKDTKTVDDHSETMATIKQVSRSIYQATMDRGANITLSDDKQEEVQEPALQVLFDFSESREIAALYKNGQVIPYQEFVENLYRENDLPVFGGGYDKTFFSLIDEQGQELTRFRYDVGSETATISEQVSSVLTQDYLRLAEEADSRVTGRVGDTEKAPDQNQEPVGEEQSMSMDNAEQEKKTPEASKEDQRVNHLVTVETRLEEPQELDTRQENAPQTFPVKQELDGFSYQTAKAEELSAQAIKAIRSYAANPEDLKEYLDFMSHFTKYSPRNTALIHEQWRGANAVATYKQWEVLGKRMGIGPDDVLGGTNVEYTNDRTGKTRTIKNEGLSVRAGQKGHIKLFKPMMDEMIPVLDETGQQLKNDKGYPKYKPKKKATAAEEEAIKQGRLEVKSFPKRDLKTGKALYKTFTVFELSQTNLKPEKYPNIMPNRHYDFDTDKVKTQEVLLGLKDYADCLGVSIEKVDMMSNVKGQFNKEDQSIQLNDQNTKGEMVGTLIHELAHATLHNPKFKDCYKEEVPKEVKELEAEMTSYVTVKHFGLDTSEKAIPYMANWTDKLSKLSDDELDQSMKRVHETTKKMLKAVEKHTKPLAQRLSPEQGLSQHQNLNPLPPKM